MIDRHVRYVTSIARVQVHEDVEDCEKFGGERPSLLHMYSFGNHVFLNFSTTFPETELIL